MRASPHAPALLATAAALVLLIAAGLGLASPTLRKIPALDPALAWPADTFRDGAYFAPPAELPPGLTTRGSRVDGVAYRGTFLSGWFAAQPRIALLVAGFPTRAGNALSLEVRDTGARTHTIPFDLIDPHESWRPWLVSLPPDATAFRIRAVDDTTDAEGWLAFTEPVTPALHPSLLPQTSRAFAAFFVQLILLASLGLATFLALRPLLARVLGSDADALAPLLATASVALLGYAAFWLTFAHPLLGKTFAWSVHAAAITLVFRHHRNASALARPFAAPLVLLAAIGVLYLSLLVLFEPARLSFTATHRFVEGLPSDNEIPRAFAERLFAGESPRQLWGDWQSSDRPPLQAGWLLLTWPLLHAQGLDLDTAATTSGLLFQLPWVLAVIVLARHLGAGRAHAFAIAAALSFTGVLLLFSVFVWPKLGAAALVLAAYLLWFPADPSSPAPPAFRFALGGLCAALGWLSHGGIAFSLLGLAPLALLRRTHRAPRIWLPALAAFALTVAPWIAYQKFYDPPGNRLLKMHLAGAPDPDTRSFPAALGDSYRTAGWSGALAARAANLAQQFHGDWSRLLRLAPHENPQSLRRDEISFTFRACGVWLLAALVPLAHFLRRRANRRPFPDERSLLLWVLATLAVWIGLMFGPSTTTIHQGSLVVPLVLLTLLAAWSLRAHPAFFVGLAVFQCIWFLLAWTLPHPGTAGRFQLAPALFAALALVILLGFVLRPLLRPTDPPRNL